MAENDQDRHAEEPAPDAARPYEAPEVENLETVEGPAVTAAGATAPPPPA